MVQSVDGPTAALHLYSDRPNEYYEYKVTVGGSGSAIQSVGGGSTDRSGSADFAVGGSADTAQGTTILVQAALTDSAADVSDADSTGQLTGPVICSESYTAQ
jgi:hypothetical protein